MKTAILNRVTTKSVKNEVKQATEKRTTVPTIDPNSPASPRLTYALYNANRAASKINGCEVYNDWHKQGLTTKEANDLISEYNKITGYVYKPKEKEVKKVSKPVYKGVKVVNAPVSNAPVNDKFAAPSNGKYAAQIQAIKEMRKEGLLTVAELTEALKGLQ